MIVSVPAVGRRCRLAWTGLQATTLRVGYVWLISLHWRVKRAEEGTYGLPRRVPTSVYLYLQRATSWKCEHYLHKQWQYFLSNGTGCVRRNLSEAEWIWVRQSIESNVLRRLGEWRGWMGKESNQLVRYTGAILACHAIQHVFYDIFDVMKDWIQHTLNWTLNLILSKVGTWMIKRISRRERTIGYSNNSVITACACTIIR